MDDLVPPFYTPRRHVRRGARAPRPVVSARLVVGMILLLLPVAVALTWSRLPDEVRQGAVESTTAMQQSLIQSFETVRAWGSARLQGTAGETTPAVAVAPPAPAVAPPSEAGKTAVTPQAPPDAGEVGTVDAVPMPLDPMTVDTAPVAQTSLDASSPAATPPASGGGPGTLEFLADSFTVSEADSLARLTVRRRGGTEGEVRFGWRTADDSAIAGEDYAATTATEVMAAGQTKATILIPIVADSVPENTELLDVVIEDTSGARLGATTQVPLIIVDDD